MKSAALSGLFALACLASAPLHAEEKSATGKIKSFECGDNCYLTITTANGEDIQGLCAAEECTAWNEQAAMPEELVGRDVEVLIGVGKQYDGNGTEMGEFPAFSKVTIGD